MRSVRRHPVAQRASRVGLVVFAAVLIAGGLYCALWVVSSASLACTACNCHYSLTASTPRCRQPYIALLLAIALFVVAAVCLYIRMRVRQADAQQFKS